MPPSDVNANVTPEMDRLLLRMLAKKPAERHADMNEIYAELRTVKVFQEDPKELADRLAAQQKKKDDEGLSSRLDSRSDAKRGGRYQDAPAAPRKPRRAPAAVEPPPPPPPQLSPTPVAQPGAPTPQPIAYPQPVAAPPGYVAPPAPGMPVGVPYAPPPGFAPAAHYPPGAMPPGAMPARRRRAWPSWSSRPSGWCRRSGRGRARKPARVASR